MQSRVLTSARPLIGAIALVVHVALTILCVTVVARAETPAPTVLIFDSSGSMAAEEPDGRSKLDAARSVVGKVLKQWPADGQLALIAYGHRRKNDCADIETVLEMGLVSPARVKRKLATLDPLGKTPISQSLRNAAALLTEGAGTIVLVSDGIETCDADPCAVARDLKKANARLLIHVVGFGLERKAISQLTCIAENSGGRFFDAKSAVALADALTTVTATIAAGPSAVAAPPPDPAVPAPPPPAPVIVPPPPITAEPTPTPPAPAKIVRVGLIAVAGELGRIVDAPVRWIVTDAKDQRVFEGESRGLSLDLPSGAYRVEAEAVNARGAVPIAVTDGQEQSFDVNVLAGRLDLSLVANKTAPPFGDVEALGIAWTLQPLDGQGPAVVPPLARPSLLLAPGRYQVRARLQGLEGEAMATVVPGAPTAVAMDFKLGTVVLEAALAADGQPLTDATMIKWRVGKGASERVIAGEARPRLVLPEGSYPVILSIAGGELTAVADVRADAERVVRVDVGGGELKLSVRLGPQAPLIDDWRDALWTIAPLGGDPAAQVIALPEAAPTVPLPPGRWRVTVTSGTAKAEREVPVAPGSATALTFDLAAARLTMRAAPASGERAANIVFSVVALGSDGNPAAQDAYRGGSSETLSAIFPAGRWRVSAIDSEGRSGDSDIELTVGEERTLDLVLK